MKRTLSPLALIGSVVLQAVPAAASPTAADRAMAQSLFEEGRRLMAEGDFDSACPKLAESQALDPSGGTILNLAVCHEKQGRLATAWSDFKEALSIARRDNRADRFEAAQQHLAALEPRVPSLTIRVVRAKPEQQVMLDGAAVRPAAWGTAIAVDPGSHRVESSAAGHDDWSAPLEVGEAEHKVIVIPELALEAGPAPAATDGGPTPGPAEAERGNGVAWVALGTGIVGLGVGSYFGVVALSTQEDVEKECPTPKTCTPEGVDLSRDAQAAAWASNIGIGVGIVGVVVGGYLLLTSPGPAKTSSARPAVPSPLRVSASPHGGELSLQGVW